jgi:CheY-like chemotaxis protein
VRTFDALAMDVREQSLQGLRVLVVEDEALVAILLEDMLADLGCEVVASAPRVGTARDLVGQKNVDCAILDVNVGGETVYSIAELLAQQGVPFMFVTGYSSSTLHSAFQQRPILQKPFRPDDLRDALKSLRVSRPAITAKRH